MTNDFFDDAFEYLIKNEGTTYTNNPLDSGGPTKFGVSLKTYQDFMGRSMLYTDIKELTLEGAKCFYLKMFWEPMCCNQMDKYAIATAILDTSVLYGPTGCTNLAQKTLSKSGAKIMVDGNMGPQTVSLLNQVDPNFFIRLFMAQIHDRIDSTIAAHPKNEAFRTGWVLRANRLLTLITNKEVS